MARYSVGARSTGAGARTSGTAGKPLGSLFAAANNDIYIIECGVFNTTTTAVCVATQRATAQGTGGSGLSELPWDPDTTAATATALDTHSADATLTAGYFNTATLGAAAGAGVIWTYGNKGIRIPKGTGNGFCIIVGTGTGQICDWYIIWDE